MEGYLIAGAQTIIVSLVVWWSQRRIEKHQKDMEKHAEARRQESLLSLKLLNANGELSEATAIAYKRGEPNGEMEKAFATYNKAKKEYFDFLDKQAFDNLQTERG